MVFLVTRRFQIKIKKKEKLLDRPPQSTRTNGITDQVKSDVRGRLRLKNKLEKFGVQNGCLGCFVTNVTSAAWKYHCFGWNVQIYLNTHS